MKRRYAQGNDELRHIWDVERIMQADTGYPPILTEDFRVFDGMHRIARHLLDGKKNIMVKRFVKNPEPYIIEGTSLEKAIITRLPMTCHNCRVNE